MTGTRAKWVMLTDLSVRKWDNVLVLRTHSKVLNVVLEVLMVGGERRRRGEGEKGRNDIDV